MTERLGRYRLLGELAAGGMASVQLGVLEGELGFARAVAIKRLHPHYARDPDFLAMLLDEARLTCRIRHAHVVPALDIVVHEGDVALVMEYVPGESLSTLLRSVHARGAKVPVSIAVALSVHLLEGLAGAHETRDETGAALHIVHRDVSPQNLLVGEDGRARLLDFGIAKAVGRMQHTRGHELKGKLAYMAPEQLARREVDGRADLFAASIVLWEMLTGTRLFAADDEVTTCARVATLEIPRVRSLRDEVSEALDAVVLRGLARPLAARWPDARTMADALARTGPVAAPREIAAWMAELDTEALVRGRALLCRNEAVAPRFEADLPTNHPLVHLARRAIEAEAPTRRGPVEAVPAEVPARRTRAWLAWTALGLMALGGMAYAMRAQPAPPPAKVSEALAAPPVEETVVEKVAAPEKPTPVEPTVAEVPVRRAKKVRPRSKTRADAAPDDCAVPFRIDESGVRIPKRHCLD